VFRSETKTPKQMNYQERTLLPLRPLKKKSIRKEQGGEKGSTILGETSRKRKRKAGKGGAGGRVDQKAEGVSIMNNNLRVKGGG